jgi:5-deoxy-glucuronate isomerase
VRFADVQNDQELRFNAGKETNQREVNILIGKNVEAGRIMAGITFSAPGNWTSWPPHEHAAMLEEAYLYIDMPAPSFGCSWSTPTRRNRRSRRSSARATSC